MLMETTVIDLPAAGSTPDHYAIRHRPSGRYLAWDDTLTLDVAPALRFATLAAADRRIAAIEPAVRGGYEVVGLRYQPAPATSTETPPC